MAESPNDTTRSITELLKLYALDSMDQRAILNRVAWTVRENGWGLLGESDQHLANIFSGEVYRIGISPLGLALIPAGPLDHSQFVDPVEPPADPPAVAVVAEAPPTPLAFLKRRADAPLPQTLDERIEAIDQKTDAILGMFETLMHILDSFHARQDRVYRGETRLMGRRVAITLTPLDPPA